MSVRVVGRLASSDCDRDLKSGCVEARRTIGFLPHTSLRLPISLDAACKDLVCASADETCVRGRCVSALVDPNTCIGGTCPDPGGDGGAPSDAASDAPTTCAPLLPAITYVWHFDDPTDNLTQEANQAFPATTLGNGDGLGTGAPACGKALVRTSATGGTKLAIGKLLTNEFFQAAFRFKTTGPQLLVLYKATPLVGWRFGVEQGKAFMESCDGQQCQTTSAGSSIVTDDQWHRVEIVSSQSGISFAVDGVAGVQLGATPKTIADATLIVTGVGSLDELTFHAN